MKVCFIGVGISAAFEGEIVGGAEKQQMLLIQGLKKNGIDVIVLEYYLNESRIINGIEFIPAWRSHHDSFFKRLKNIESQIYSHKVDAIYARGTQLYASYLYLLLKLKKTKIKRLWGIAGDHDLTSKFNYLRVNHYSSLYAKINAGIIFNISSILAFYFSNIIICQTDEQVLRCKTISLKKRITKISNIYSKNLIYEKSSLSPIYADAIWIGKFSGTKGEEILLNLAKDIPQMSIICLGHVTDNFRNTNVYSQIENQENLILKGRVPNEKVAYYISKANFIINTSPSEGLSNVFLEGWDLEKPVISYIVNPNQYLTKGNAGFCAKGSYKDLVINLQKKYKDRKFLNAKGKNGKEILIKNHSSSKILKKYITLIHQK